MVRRLDLELGEHLAKNIPLGGFLDKIMNRRKGAKPYAWAPIQLAPNPHAMAPGYQEKQTWPWPSAPAHEQRSALVNCWTGNQLPGDVNFIPGVWQSYSTWNIPTSYANTLKNQQFNVAQNILTQSSWSSAQAQQIAQIQWANRVST